MGEFNITTRTYRVNRRVNASEVVKRRHLAVTHCAVLNVVLRNELVGVTDISEFHLSNNNHFKIT